jgi:hypothetical protein
MTSRLLWLAAGVSVGVAVARRLDRSPDATTVEAAAGRVVGHARRVVHAVIADGRAEMRMREARLRAVLAAPDEPARGATRDER